MKEKLLAELLEKYLDRSCTKEEEIRLMELLNDPLLDTVRDRLIENAYDHLPQHFLMTDLQTETVFRKVVEQRPPITITYRRRPVLRWTAIAASVMMILAWGTYMILTNNRSRTLSEPVVARMVRDIPSPSGNRATIVLANGQTIFLDSVGNGTLAIQGHVSVVKTVDGEIAYHSGESGEESSLYNTLRNPRGSKVISLKLADGTKVWLNAESTLRYPASFTGTERKVEITGEAYFEVYDDARMPFVVSRNGTEIKVLGTHFNVNAYDDESDLKVTLLEGAVRISDRGDSYMLHPGQQAKVGNGIQVVNDVNMEQVMAWKNGFFHFQGASLQEVMHQLGRWYDVDVIYEGIIAEHRFVGKVDRDYNLSEVLAVLGASDVHYRIEGKRLIVQP